MAADDAATPQEGVAAEATEEKGYEVLREGSTPDLTNAVPAPPEPTPEAGIAPDARIPQSEPQEPEVPPEQKAEAAQAESEPESNHRVTYKAGDVAVELQLPPNLLASFKYRMAALDDDDPQVLKVIKKLLTQEQFERVMDAMDEAGLVDEHGEPNAEAETTFGNLLNDALATYGLTAGESQASMNS